MSPKTLRFDGSLSQPSRRSGPDRWKKLRAQLLGGGRDAHGE
jgi:hypothetical protein